jgi:hypothetical protein
MSLQVAAGTSLVNENASGAAVGVAMGSVSLAYVRMMLSELHQLTFAVVCLALQSVVSL